MATSMPNPELMELTTSFTYAKNSKVFSHEKPYVVLTTLTETQNDSNLEWERGHPETITNIRGMESAYTLDTHGFQFLKSDLAGLESRDWRNRKEVEEVYLPEMKSFLEKNVEGVDEVVFFDWRLRTAARISTCTNNPEYIVDLNNPADEIPPAAIVHLDQSPAGTLKRVRLIAGDRAQFLLRGRVRIINIWRPLSHVLNWPLVVADGRTMSYDDLHEVDLIRRNYIGSTMYCKWREGYKWFFLDGQTPTEVCLFKNFDSEEDVEAQICPHVSFPLKGVSTERPPRESIEIRALVFTYPQ
jgi:hypothetical protein